MHKETKNIKDILIFDKWRLINILSLDVVVGAVASGIMAIRLLHADMQISWWIVLAISVWIIYTVDHLIDGLKLKYDSHTIRHFYHFHYRKTIIVVISVLVISNIMLVFCCLDERIVRFGLVLSAITGIYLFMIFLLRKRKSLLIQKEFFVAVIYTAGIWGGPLSLVSFNIDYTVWGIIFSFFLIVFSAILTLSLFESEIDKLDNHNTFTVNLGRKKTLGLIFLLQTFAFLISIAEIIFATEFYVIASAKIMMIMNVSLLVILGYEEKLKKGNIYRVLVEILFWIPGFFVLL